MYSVLYWMNLLLTVNNQRLCLVADLRMMFHTPRYVINDFFSLHLESKVTAFVFFNVTLGDARE